MAAPQKHIDLIPREGFEYTTAGKVLTWALSAGRVIVVLTELIVILAFLSRFWLDRQLTDLNEKIQTQTAIIQASADFEREFRSVQAALTSFSQISKLSPNVSQVLDRVVAALPVEVSLQSLNLTSEILQIKGVSLSEAGVAGFIKNLESEGFTQVELTSISAGTETESIGITFGLSAKLAK